MRKPREVKLVVGAGDQASVRVCGAWEIPVPGSKTGRPSAILWLPRAAPTKTSVRELVLEPIGAGRYRFFTDQLAGYPIAHRLDNPADDIKGDVVARELRPAV